MAYVHGASAHPGLCSGRVARHGQLQLPSEWSLPNRRVSPGDAGASGANACLGGGPLGAPHRLALMLLASCVFGREKNTRRRCCLAAPLARALSLAPSLFCALPPFANIGFKPARDSAQRKAAGSRSSSRSGSQPRSSRSPERQPQPQDVPPRLLGRLLRHDRPALHPRYRGRRGGSAVPERC